MTEDLRHVVPKLAAKITALGGKTPRDWERLVPAHLSADALHMASAFAAEAGRALACSKAAQAGLAETLAAGAAAARAAGARLRLARFADATFTAAEHALRGAVSRSEVRSLLERKEQMAAEQDRVRRQYAAARGSDRDELLRVNFYLTDQVTALKAKLAEMDRTIANCNWGLQTAVENYAAFLHAAAEADMWADRLGVGMATQVPFSAEAAADQPLLRSDPTELDPPAAAAAAACGIGAEGAAAVELRNAAGQCVPVACSQRGEAVRLRGWTARKRAMAEAARVWGGGAHGIGTSTGTAAARAASAGAGSLNDSLGAAGPSPFAGGDLTASSFRLAALWLQYGDSKVSKAMWSWLPLLPAGQFVPLAHQVFARIADEPSTSDPQLQRAAMLRRGDCSGVNETEEQLEHAAADAEWLRRTTRLLARGMGISHPHSVLSQLCALENAGLDHGARSTKSRAASTVLDQVAAASPAHALAVGGTRLAVHAYLALAHHGMEDRKPNRTEGRALRSKPLQLRSVKLGWAQRRAHRSGCADDGWILKPERNALGFLNWLRSSIAAVREPQSLAPLSPGQLPELRSPAPQDAASPREVEALSFIDALQPDGVAMSPLHGYIPVLTADQGGGLFPSSADAVFAPTPDADLKQAVDQATCDSGSNWFHCWMSLSGQSEGAAGSSLLTSRPTSVRPRVALAHVPDCGSFASTGVTFPKRVSVIGTDGLSYSQMAKGGEEDMRQDAVMQQFFGVVNRLLATDQQARQRGLQVRRYKVVPLAPVGGVAEWVGGAMSIGEYLVGSSSKPGAHQRFWPKDVSSVSCRRKMDAAKTGTDEEKVGALLEIAASFRPAMQFFFPEHYPSPEHWTARRTTYTRSVAVSSMAGHIVGLGDRHINNILVDRRTAELVHIDFGLVFEQGHSLRTPERVPFRLTRDMVAGMGPPGVEGVCRRAAEVSLGLMRRHQRTIMVVLDVIVHDPFYRWALSAVDLVRRQQSDQEDDGASTVGQSVLRRGSSGASSRRRSSSSRRRSAHGPADVDLVDGGAVDSVTTKVVRSGEQFLAEQGQAVVSLSKEAEMAPMVLERCKAKLQGFESNVRGTAPLTVPAQVQVLLRDAASPQRMATMFPGWSMWC